MTCRFIKYFFLSISVLSLALSGCNASDRAHIQHEGDTIPMSYAANLTMIDCGDYTAAIFRNPWDTTKTLQKFLLVADSVDLPENLPEGIVLRTPLKNSIVYTAVHTSLIDEFGHIEAVSGVCDVPYIYNPKIKEQIAAGKIEDCGSSMAPNIEKIIALSPDAILVSAYENFADHNKVAQLGIPVIDCPDYMETSPLGRAEWMKFFGRLYGEGEKADSLFAATANDYNNLKGKLQLSDSRPKIMTDLIYGGTWDMPGANSTIGIIINDAGGKNPFDQYKVSGSVKLSPEEVLYTAGDADIWIIKYASSTPLDMKQLARENEIYTKFAPYKEGNVYGCNTLERGYFEEIPFHPQWLLQEFAALLHPESGAISQRNYYKKLQP